MRVRGRLMVATPELDDPNFYRSVVLILEHKDEGGAMGLVLNRTLKASAETVVPYWADRLKPPGTLHYGGPVSEESIVGLARIPIEQTDGVASLVGTVGVLDLYRRPDELPGVESLRLFAGYAGWEAGQLEAELAVGGWILVDPIPEDLLTDNPSGLWREVLRRQEGFTSLLARYPDNLSSN